MQAIANPEELRAFAAALDRLCEDLRQRKSVVGTGFERLHETWRDTRYEQFEETFGEAKREIDRFLSVSEQFSHYLRRKAEPLERFLRGRRF